ncbi:MAG: hypothetical protein HY805_05215 [Nitrospirae bacterium]|nr:hypothetical protein [Nitrospirota bacterium]
MDYMDNDVAYLLGMIMVRGSFHVERDVKRLLIHFPYQLMEVKGLPDSKLKFNQETEIRLNLDDVRKRINELLEVNEGGLLINLNLKKLRQPVALRKFPVSV